MKIKITFVIFIITIAASLSAQEQLTPEEMFRWFPEIKFSSFGFYDLSEARKLPGFDKYLKHIAIPLHRNGALFQVPEQLQDKWLSVVRMSSVKLVVSGEKGGKTAEFGNGLALAVDIGDTLYKVTRVGYPMQVIRFPADLDLHKIFLAQEGVSKTVYTAYNSPIYFCSVRYPGRNNPSYYFYLSPENEVVACPEWKFLKKMLDTGHGVHPAVSENFPLPHFWEIIPDLGPKWTLGHHASTYKALVMKLEKDGVDKSIIDGQKKFIKISPAHISTVSFAKEPVLRSISLHSTKEEAKESYQAQLKSWHKPNPRVHRDELGTLRYMQTDLKLNGKMVIRETTLSDEYIRKYLELREKRQKEDEPQKPDSK